MTQQPITTDIDDDGVACITLDRAEKHNAFDDALIAELTAIFENLGQNDNVRLIVLAAKGKSFSAGADLGWMQRMATYSYDDNLRDANALARMLHVLNHLPKPTIARVQGAAFGGAVGLVSCCDLAVASTRASFSLSEVKIGLIPATISPYVINAIGQRAARRYFLTAERFGAEQAKQLGLVSEVCEEQEMDTIIQTWKAQLLTNSPQAIAAAKQLVFDVAGKPLDQTLLDDTSQRIANIRVSPEGQEGLTAFLEKRKPDWVK